MNGITTKHFQTAPEAGGMTRPAMEQLAARENLGLSRKLWTLDHQARAAMADGRLEDAAWIEHLKAELTA